jgi:DNA-binding protein HU-beta
LIQRPEPAIIDVEPAEAEMTKSELIERVAERAELTRAAAARAVDAIFDTASGAISEAVHSGGSFSLPGFGRFAKKTRPAGKRRSPRDGVVIDVPERSTVTFRPGRGLRAAEPAFVPARAAGKLARRSATPRKGRDPEQVREIRKLAEHVWENRADAEVFLANPHPLLGGMTPLDAARTRAGAARVKDLLMRLEYGLPA